MRIGARVQVYGGDGKQDLGEGIYVGEATVYVRRNPDGTLSSPIDAETKPDGEGWEELGNNPKIVLDSGRTVYGCQVWWDEIPSVEIVMVLPTNAAEIEETGEEALYLGGIEVYLRANAKAIATKNLPAASICDEKPPGEGWHLLDSSPRMILNDGTIVVNPQEAIRFTLKGNDVQRTTH